jgi:hypothetical protein
MGSLLGMMLGPRNAAQGGSAPVPMGSGMVIAPGMTAGANPDLALIRTYKMNGTVRSNVGLIAESVAEQDWVLFRKAGPAQRYTTSDRGSDPRKQVTVHAALNVLEMPASVVVDGVRKPIFDRFTLFELSEIWMTQTGKCHWVVDFAEGASKIPLGLWPVRPDRMTPVPDRNKFLAGWIYTSPDGREQVPLLPTEVIFNRFSDPEDLYGGCGPVQSVLTDIEAADYAGQWNRNFFINSAEPGGVIQLDHEFQEGEFNRIVSQWRETHRGVARAHRIAVLEAGVTWVPNQHGSVKDMDFAKLRETMRDIIREALGMAKVMTGVSDDVNRANAQTGQEVFASWKVEPRLKRWRNVLNTQFLPLFGETGQGVELDFVYPRVENREADALELTAKCNAVLALVTAGYDQHDALAQVGLNDMKVALTLSDQPALPPRWTAPLPAQAAPAAAPAGAQGALRSAAGWGSPLWADMDARALPVMAGRRAFPGAGGAAPQILDKNAAAKVFEQVAEDYPASAMAWMHHATWTGPVRVPLEHIEPDMQWMDGADPDHVAEFVERRRKGKKLKPLLLVKTPGDPLLKLIDGHHRYLAEAELGEAPRAWIGTVDADHGDWETMHEHQFTPSAGGGAGRGDGPSARADDLRRRLAAWNAVGAAR